MLSLATVDAQRDAIILTHEVIETARVFTTLLDALYNGEVQSFSDMYLVGYIIDLAEKWEFSRALKVIRQSLRATILSGPDIDVAKLLLVAVKLKDYDSIAFLIEAKGHIVWKEKTSDKAKSMINPCPEYISFPYYATLLRSSAENDINRKCCRGGFFEPGAMSQSMYCLLPPMVHWAMARAILLVANATGKRDDWGKIGKEFKRLMNDACESVSLQIWSLIC